MSGVRKNGLTYADAGVDIDAGNALVEAIKPLVRATRRPGADAEIGGFGGLFDLKACGFRDPVLVAANDGVGTKLKIAIDRAHNESRPTVIEVMTYRHFGHSVADANEKKYRSPDEIEQYKQQNDPIVLWKNRLLAEGVLTEERYKDLDKAAKAEAAASAVFADESPFPEVSAITEDVYYEVDEFTEAGRTGKHFFNE